MRKLIFLLLGWLPTIVFGKSIALVTVVIGPSYYETTWPGTLSKQKYCELHGYDFICVRESLDPTRHHPWQKIKAVQQLLKQYDWVFWSDADSIIMNDKIQLESLIDDNYSFIICYDNISNVVNSGQFLIKNSEQAYTFLDNVYSKQEFISHPWWENAAIIETLKEQQFSGRFVKVLPQRSMNSFAYEICGNNPQACYQGGDFIVHFPSIRNAQMLDHFMKLYYDHRSR